MDKPFVLKNSIDSWPALKWTPDSLAEALGNLKIRIRLGPKKHRPGSVLWETESKYVQASLKQFVDWIRGDDDDYDDDSFILQLEPSSDEEEQESDKAASGPSKVSDKQPQKSMGIEMKNQSKMDRTPTKSDRQMGGQKSIDTQPPKERQVAAAAANQQRPPGPSSPPMDPHLYVDPKAPNPFARYYRDDYWAYIDYKRLNDLFIEQKNSKYLADVDWSRFDENGANNVDGLESTFWMGTRGAYTPCHYDTYGFNLVAQLFGRKRWALFPPADDLQSTRVPYEESSVFSSLDLIAPSATQLERTHPYLVTLEPGDVLFVPPRWWHSVQSMDEISISVNHWVTTPDDDDEWRKVEAMTQLLVSMVVDKDDTEEVRKVIIGDLGDDEAAIAAAAADPPPDHPLSYLDVENNVSILDHTMMTRVRREDTSLDDFLARWRPIGIEVPRIYVDEFCRVIYHDSPVEIDEQGGSRMMEPRHRVVIERDPLFVGLYYSVEKLDVLKAMTHPDVVRTILAQLKKVKKIE